MTDLREFDGEYHIAEELRSLQYFVRFNIVRVVAHVIKTWLTPSPATDEANGNVTNTEIHQRPPAHATGLPLCLGLALVCEDLHPPLLE